MRRHHAAGPGARCAGVPPRQDGRTYHNSGAGTFPMPMTAETVDHGLHEGNLVNDQKPYVPQ